MRRITLVTLLILLLSAAPVAAQGTVESLVDTFNFKFEASWVATATRSGSTLRCSARAAFSAIGKVLTSEASAPRNHCQPR